MTLRFGLIGKKLSHSFSKKYFTEKFEREKLDCVYDLFELETIDTFKTKVSTIPNITGVNVTLPYKEQIIPYLDSIDPDAAEIGAVNVIKYGPNGRTRGYNTDVIGFKKSFTETAEKANFSLSNKKALVLGTGGAAKAVFRALVTLNIPFHTVSRDPSKATYSYDELQKPAFDYTDYAIIINTSPVGMYPNVDEAPTLLYQKLNSGYYVYDLVYNPTETKFMQLATMQGALAQCGLDMLHYQADAAWHIWMHNE